MARRILICKTDDGWRLRCEGALFEEVAHRGEALRLARAHAALAERAGETAEIAIREPRRPIRS